MDQMGTVTTCHVDLREKFIQWEYTCYARQRFTVSWKQNIFVRHHNHCRHFTVLCCRYLLSTAPCLKRVFHDRMAGPLTSPGVFLHNCIHTFSLNKVLYELVPSCPRWRDGKSQSKWIKAADKIFWVSKTLYHLH